MSVCQQPIQSGLTERSLPQTHWGRQHCTRSTLSLLGEEQRRPRWERLPLSHQAQAALPQTSWLSLLEEPQAPIAALHRLP